MDKNVLLRCAVVNIAGSAGWEEVNRADQNTGAPPGDGTPGSEEPTDVHNGDRRDTENQYRGVTETGERRPCRDR